MRISARSALSGAIALLFCSAFPVAADETIALRAARLFDGKSKTLVQNGVVIVQGEKIVDAGSNLPVPEGTRVIDLADATLSPGFMDAHTHLTLDLSGNYNEKRLQELQTNVSEMAILATTYARMTVEAGFTTVRDLGTFHLTARICRCRAA
jgi:imidazolonepropionase-like amidohydrolase